MTTAPTSFRLSASERAAVEAAADAAGLGVSSFARAATLAAAGRKADVRRKPDSTAEALARVLGALGRIGNNANQMARHSHTGGRVPADALAGVRRELEALTAAVLRLREPRK